MDGVKKEMEELKGCRTRRPQKTSERKGWTGGKQGQDDLMKSYFALTNGPNDTAIRDRDQ